MSAPISAGTSNSPVRDGLSPTPSIVTSDPGTISAATSGKAAEDGSPGTTIGAAVELGLALDRDPPTAAALGLARTVAPKWRSMRSVWSRVGSARSPWLTPGVLSPASSTADLTCADGTGRR